MVTQPFPSLVISADRLEPQGAFVEALAEYLQPDDETVAQLTDLLATKNAGVVAHFYMDPQLQGVLSASSWPHIHIADSLKMADAAVEMVRAGVETVVVLGVDFMSENVRATLDATGFAGVEVYRVSSDPIGCSLAEAAESKPYLDYLTQAAQTPRSLHVIYVNTSLRTKAIAVDRVPTITCTSSNVVHTILQAAAQVPDVHVWYGPDTYMGRNLQQLLTTLPALGNDAIAALHPQHDRRSIQQLIERFHYFDQGVCIVHHMFGETVTEKIRTHYPDAWITAHLEVPGEMFTLGLEAQRLGRGVVGSTSNILDFITRQVRQATQEDRSQRLPFVLGTESGMITSIARRVQSLLKSQPPNTAKVEAEIIFPVASEAIAEAPGLELPVVPGVAEGEGCSMAGGCATCPYMKMNSLDALLEVLEQICVDDAALDAFRPKQYTETIGTATIAELGGVSIRHMRALQQTSKLPETLVKDIRTRPGPPDHAGLVQHARGG